MPSSYTRDIGAYTSAAVRVFVDGNSIFPGFLYTDVGSASTALRNLADIYILYYLFSPQQFNDG